MIKSDLITAYAVKSSVVEISNQLTPRYTPLFNLPIMWFDWNEGYSKQFLQYFAQVPEIYRNAPWITITYSYGESKPMAVQPRHLKDVHKVLYSNSDATVVASLDVRPVSVDIICSILTNDSNYADSLSLNRVIQQSLMSSITFQDVFQSSWLANSDYPDSFKIIATVPNGYLYQCITSGTTGDIEPEWPTILGEIITDGTVEWQCITGEALTGSISNYTLPKIVTSDYFADGIKYVVNFGYTLNFINVVDINYDLSPIRGFDNWLFARLSNVITI